MACACPSQAPTDPSRLAFLCLLAHASLPRRDSGPQPLPGPFRNITSCGSRSWATVTIASVACPTTARTTPSAPSSWGSPWWRPSRKWGPSGRGDPPGPIGKAGLMCRSHGGPRTPRPPQRDPLRHVTRDVVMYRGVWPCRQVARSPALGSRVPARLPRGRGRLQGLYSLRGARSQPRALFSPGSSGRPHSSPVGSGAPPQTSFHLPGAFSP